MKHFKKLFSYFVALAMVLTIVSVSGISVHAADSTTTSSGTTYTLTVRNNNGTKDGSTNHTFEVYQIFTGDYNGGVLSNIEWGSGVTSTGQSAFGSAKTYAKTLKDESNASSFASELVTGKDGTTYLQKAATLTIEPGSSKSVKVAPGYYLIKDQDGSQNNGAYTQYILKVVGDVTANTKLDVPTVEKKVKDVDDSVADSETGWQDSADYDIGDDVPYQLTGTLPSDYAKYTSYTYKFTDTMSSGLTFNNDIKVYLNSATDANLVASTNYKVESTANSFTLTFDNLKNVTTTASDKIIVLYSAKLNKNAETGSKGNQNTVTLTYSNNPNNTGKGETGSTPEDKNIVFTYKLNVNKYKDSVSDPNKTTAAEFKLYKELSNGTAKEVTVTKDSENKIYTAKGLDDGKYILQETKAPDGYNKMDGSVSFGGKTYENAKEFTITATHDGTSDDPKLQSLSGNLKNGEAFTVGTKEESSAAGKTTTTTYTGELTTSVVDQKGSTLPSTGGMGTTLLYVAGGILVACAAAYVIINRKKSAKK